MKQISENTPIHKLLRIEKQAEAEGTFVILAMDLAGGEGKEFYRFILEKDERIYLMILSKSLIGDEKISKVSQIEIAKSNRKGIILKPFLKKSGRGNLSIKRNYEISDLIHLFSKEESSDVYEAGREHELEISFENKKGEKFGVWFSNYCGYILVPEKEP
ncbi:MAG: hypothetical protein HGA37_16015 [Lentimicrobium sp.]|nr:hypothetical protein [Lentimicrobium sp.]